MNNIDGDLNALNGAIIISSLGQPAIVIMSYMEYKRILCKQEQVAYKSGWYAVFEEEYLPYGEE